MLFHTYPFLIFLLVVLAAFFVAGRLSARAPIYVLIAASLFFYGYWSPLYLPLLIGSIIANFAFGAAIDRGKDQATRRWTLIAAIALNLALLGYFKYANFLVSSIGAVTGAQMDMLKITLPIGISFFTFTQIAYLVDVYKREAQERSFASYALFVTFFPHLVAGPILHHKEMMPQFAKRETFRPNVEKIAIGALLFVMGLFKKVVFADSLAPFANSTFSGAEAGHALDAFAAWGGALAYTFQLYFDFSGYSDMAIGIALMFGVWMPTNFESPYKSVSIIEFWRRWHMTLSRFLRDYLYIPLGGNRHGRIERYRNLMITMALGGLWHGASWSFVIWGVLHGLYLTIAHLANDAGFSLYRVLGKTGGRFAGWLMTFACVVVAWVFFRATSLSGAMTMLQAMAGSNGADLDNVQRFLAAPEQWGVASPILVALIAFLAPNSLEIADKAKAMLARKSTFAVIGAGAAIGMAFLVGLIFMGEGNEFLYFQF